MRVWKHSPLDAILVAVSLAQFALTLWLASSWERYAVLGRVGSFFLLLLMMTYNIIVVSHVFTHVPWFTSIRLNGLVSMLNSINIGQSVQSYHLLHVRNHHRYNNDAKHKDGTTNDISSTYRDGVDGEHASLYRYALVGGVSTLVDVGRDLLSVTRVWCVGAQESKLHALMSRAAVRRSRELRQIQMDRMSRFLGIVVFLLISWRWTLECYLPAFYAALVLVNVQNYYEHYGAMPGSRMADSVSYYGYFYNLLTFNDGYHQEHHLRPLSHWSDLPVVREQNLALLNQVERIVSPTPAILGFLYFGRPLLHHRATSIPLSAAGPQS